jgi:hypothetical protein
MVALYEWHVIIAAGSTVTKSFETHNIVTGGVQA